MVGDSLPAGFLVIIKMISIGVVIKLYVITLDVIVIIPMSILYFIQLMGVIVGCYKRYYFISVFEVILYFNIGILIWYGIIIGFNYMTDNETNHAIIPAIIIMLESFIWHTILNSCKIEELRNMVYNFTMREHEQN